MIIFRNYIEILKRKFPIVLIYAVVLMVLLSVFSNSVEKKKFMGYEQSKVRIIINNYDEDGSLSNGLIKFLEQSCEILSVNGTWQDELDALYYDNASYILTIPSGFSVNYLTENKSELNTSYVKDTKEADYVNQAICGYLEEVDLMHQLNVSATISEIVQALGMTSYEMSFVVEESVWNGEKATDTNFQYNLLGFILVACIISIVCSSMRAYRCSKMSRRHSIAPLSNTVINAQLLLGNLVYSYLYTIIFLAFDMIIGNKNALDVKTILYWLNTFAFVTSVLFLAYFLSFRFNNSRMVYLLANMAGLIIALMSGIFIRQEYLAHEVQKIASFTPVYWYVAGNDCILKMDTYTISTLLPLIQKIGILMLFAAAFFAMILVGAKVDEARG